MGLRVSSASGLEDIVMLTLWLLYRDGYYIALVVQIADFGKRVSKSRARL